MRFFNSIISLILFTLTFQVNAQTISCKNIFNNDYDVKEFVIQLNGKKMSSEYLETAHSNLLSKANLNELGMILMTIRESGLTEITASQIEIINNFRQDTSFLRSVYQTSSKKHESPKKFSKFVRDFGHLKDMVNIGENEKAQKMAKKILKKFVEIDFEFLVYDAKPASRKSAKKYFKSIIKDTQEIMSKDMMEIDELHDVRKNIRDILRYMQIQNELQTASIELSAQKSDTDNEQIQFLKKINKKLGEVCDNYAAQIIRGELTDSTLVEFPIKIRTRVEWFLEHYRFEGDE